MPNRSRVRVGARWRPARWPSSRPATVAAQGQRQEASAPITIEKQGSFAVGGKILGDAELAIAALRSRLRRLPDSGEPAPDQPGDVAQRRGGGVAESLGRRRRLPEHLPAPRLPGLHLGRPARRPRQLGLHGTHLHAGHRPGSGELHRMAVRREVPELVRGRAVPDEGRRGLEPGLTRALPRVRHGRERAAAVGRRGEADGQDRSERRAHQFRRRHARHPDGAQDEQHGRHRDVRERRLRLSAG